MPNGNGKQQPRSSNAVYVGQNKQSIHQTNVGWLPAVIVVCQQPDGSPAVICGPEIDAQSVLMAVAQGLRQTELSGRKTEQDNSPQAVAERLRRSGFMLP